MKAKINDKILCIPPYVSTQWTLVSSLHSDEDPNKISLIINFVDGKIIKIENIDPALRDLAFAAHLQYLEKSSSEKPGILQAIFGEQVMNGIPFRIDIANKGIGEGFENMEMAFQHNASQAQIPNLPEEVLEKITTIARAFMNGDIQAFPKPEPHCNCVHCQVARGIHKIGSTIAESEPVKDEELTFRPSWDILHVGENLYSVTDPINSKVKFNVFLGDPLGCTCGDPKCEHIKAVLSSEV